MLVATDRLLREPGLLLPGRKPVGAVRLDRAHPLARGLASYWLGGHRDLLRRPVIGSGATQGIYPGLGGGPGFVSTSGNTNGYVELGTLWDSMPGFTVILCAMPALLGVNYNSGLFGTYTTSEANTILFRFVSTTSAARYIQLYSRTATSGLVGPSATVTTELPVDEWVWLVGRVRAGTQHVAFRAVAGGGAFTWRGGDAVTGTYGTPPRAARLGYQSSSQSSPQIPIIFSALWTRGLADGEVEQFCRNPFDVVDAL